MYDDGAGTQGGGNAGMIVATRQRRLKGSDVLIRWSKKYCLLLNPIKKYWTSDFCYGRSH